MVLRMMDRRTHSPAQASGTRLSALIFRRWNMGGQPRMVGNWRFSPNRCYRARSAERAAE
jgi:hypothetical protein